MIPSEAAKQLLEGFNAPLGTFSARIKASLALGLITKEQYADLEHLRKIRNEFAHHWRRIDLSSHSVSAHVRALTFGSLTKQYPESAAEKVRQSLTSLLTEIRSTTRQIQEEKWRATLRGTHLVLGFPLGSFEEQMATAVTEFQALCSAMEAATGERRRFHEMLMRRFASKMKLLHFGCPPEARGELKELDAKVTNALQGMSD
jgi:DNA-binding MltR family transcriptional regulator